MRTVGPRLLTAKPQRSVRRRITLATCIASALAIAADSANADDAGRSADCSTQGASLEVHSHRLLLCDKGRMERSFVVSLGRGGLGKRAAGDRKTPLGTYDLGRPRPSTAFGIFIPVGYPTNAQRAAGYTGGDIGVHGPKTRWKWLGRMADVADWTRGCIALNREDDIAAVASWVRAHHARTIRIFEE